MAYNPMLCDKLRLCDYLSSKDLYDTLTNLNNVDVSCNDSYYASVLDDFDRNGVTVELDEVDQLQTKMRQFGRTEYTTHYPIGTNNQTPASVLTNRGRNNKNKLNSKVKVCVFCKNNEEEPSVYRSHVLKDNSGRITCPVLRRYSCPICAAVGDNAHTIRYCPKNTNGVGLKSLLD
ncbi:regulation of nuclear-transcribed mRNA catabolic process [Mactra antiquata]